MPFKIKVSNKKKDVKRISKLNSDNQECQSHSRLNSNFINESNQK